jgi:PAS domain S-box-containing protein
MVRGRRASGSTLRHRIDERHREVMARGLDPATGRIQDGEFLRHYLAILQQILATPEGSLPDPRLASAPEVAREGGLAGDRKRAGHELIIFRRLAEVSGYGFCVADIKGRITYANRALCRLLAEQSPEELIGRDLPSCYPQEVQESFAIHIIPTVVKNGQWAGELPLRAASGGRTPTLQNIFVVHGEAGASPYLANLIIDITDRKRAEEALRQSEERHRLLVENLEDAVFTIDRTGRVTYISRAVESFMGYRPEEVVGRSYREFVYQDDRERVDRQFAEIMAGRAIPPTELRLLTKGVEIRWARSSSRPLVVDDQVVGIHGLLSDITASKHVEEALQKSEEKFSKAFRLSPDSMFIYRLSDGEILEVNDSFLRTTGFRKSDVAGKPVRAFKYWARPGGQGAFHRALQESGRAESAEVSLRSSDGRLVPVTIGAQSIELAGLPCAICVARDISDRRRSEEFIRHQRELVERLRGADGLSDAIRICVETALKVSEFDAGGFYLFDDATGDLHLRYATGLSPDFVSRVSRYPADVPQARLVLEGRPLYTTYEQLPVLPTEARVNEGLRAVAAVPVPGGGRILGLLNVASHVRVDVPIPVREALEAVAAHAGGVVIQDRAADALRQCEHAHQSLLAMMPQGVARHRLILDENEEPRDYEVLDVNPAFAHLAGATRAALVGKRSREVYGGEVPFQLDVLRRVALAEEPASFEADCPGFGKRLRIQAFAPGRGQFILMVEPATAGRRAGP